MSVFLVAIFCWFMYDAIIGYPQKNLSFYYHQAFVKAGEDYRTQKAEGRFDAEEWKDYVATQKVFAGVPAEELPKGTNLNTPWPSNLEDYGSIERNLTSRLPARLLWEDFVPEKGLKSVDAPENAKSAETIWWQYASAYIALGLGVITAAFTLFMKGKSISITNSSITLPSGKELSFKDIKKIDDRKWAEKGLAHLYYNDQQGEHKARIDGFVFGGFEPGSGSAEAMMESIKNNFQGEYV